MHTSKLLLASLTQKIQWGSSSVLYSVTIFINKLGCLVWPYPLAYLAYLVNVQFF